MRQTVRQKECEMGGMPDAVREWLTPPMIAALSHVKGRWEELHLHAGRCAWVTADGQNRMTALTLNGQEMDALVVRMCRGSMYAYRQSINEGYIALSGGIRVGVCGLAASEEDGGRLFSVRAVDSLCIRFPHRIEGVGQRGEDIVRACLPRGVLFFAPPGQGKTTLLRALAVRLAGGETPMRVAVIDTRRELDDGSLGGALCLSLLSGYPKGLGLEIATRTLDAQLAVCDEIGPSEAPSVLAAANGGVPVIASAHAATLEELMRRPDVQSLHQAGVFGAYVGIHRQGGERDFAYKVCMREEMEEGRCP